jgi:hypothetical protein
MARSFFVLYPGIKAPAQFKANYLPVRLTQQDIWEASRLAPPSLLFRIRSVDGTPLTSMTPADKLESCVGMVDAATRWRCVFRMASIALAGVRDPKLAEVCNNAMQFISTQHPAGVAQAMRRKIAEDIMTAAGAESVNGFEQRVAQGIAALSLADSDVEAAHLLPFTAAFMPYSETEQPEEFRARDATIATISGSVLVTEAAVRLAERIPQWMFSQMPALQVASPPPRGGVRSDAEPEDEDDGPDGL